MGGEGGKEGQEGRDRREGREGRKGCGHLLEAVILYYQMGDRKGGKDGGAGAYWQAVILYC